MTVVEKNGKDMVGGRLNEMVKTCDKGVGFRFDTGPSLLLLPETYRETFRGKSLWSYSTESGFVVLNLRDRPITNITCPPPPRQPIRVDNVGAKHPPLPCSDVLCTRQMSTVFGV